MKPKPKPPQSQATDLTPAQKRAIDMVLSYAADDDYLEIMEANRRSNEDAAAKELDRLAIEFAAQETERRRLWGKKFPRVLGQKPDEPATNAIHPVKPTSTKINRRRPSAHRDKKAR